MRTQKVLGTAILTIAAAACGGGDDEAAPSTTAATAALGITTSTSVPGATAGSTTTAVPTRQGVLDRSYVANGFVSSASTWRDDLLSVGAGNADPANKASESLGIVEAWTGAFPFLNGSGRLVGSSVEAPNSGISGFTVVTKNAKDTASADNPLHLAFAVKDTAGKCAAGALTGFPAPTTATKLSLSPGSPCTAAAAAKAGGF